MNIFDAIAGRRSIRKFTDRTPTQAELAQLLQAGRSELVAEFGLAEQKALQQRVRAELEVRQHPQLFC